MECDGDSGAAGSSDDTRGVESLSGYCGVEADENRLLMDTRFNADGRV